VGEIRPIDDEVALALAQTHPLALAISQPLDQHPAAVYLASLASPRSRATMEDALQVIAGLLSGGALDLWAVNWAMLRYQHTAAIRSALAMRYPSAASANQRLAALRGVLKEAWRLGLLPIEEYQRAVDLRPIKGEAAPKGRHIPSEELGALLQICAADDTITGVRDAALLGVLYNTGMRRSEVVALDLVDYQTKRRALVIRQGKGNKARTVYLSASETKRLERWIAARGSWAGPLWCAISKAKRVITRRLSDQAVLYLLQKRAEEAGVERFSPHDVRRTFIGDLLDKGVDLSTAQRMAGHADVKTTARYDRRGERAQQQAAERLQLPDGDSEA
jgi:site-specific recombinase XerD